MASPYRDSDPAGRAAPDAENADRGGYRRMVGWAGTLTS